MSFGLYRVNERLDILENEHDLTIQPEFRKELDLMCNLSQGIYEQGKKIGETEKAKKMAVSLHESGVTEELIAKAANVSVEIVRKWLGLSIV